MSLFRDHAGNKLERKKKALKIFVYISWRARLERDRSRLAMQAEKFHFYSMNNKRNRGEVGKVFFSSFSLSLPQLEARNAQVKNCLEKHDRLPPNRKPSGVSEWENEVMPHGDGVEKLFSCQNYHGASRKKNKLFRDSRIGKYFHQWIITYETDFVWRAKRQLRKSITESAAAAAAVTTQSSINNLS